MEVSRITKELNQFVKKEAAKRGTQKYRVLQKRTIAEIAENQPETQDELKEIYGIGDTKARKYGAKILRIVKGVESEGAKKAEKEGGNPKDNKPLTVGEFLDKTNQKLRELNVRVKGEVVECGGSNSGHFYPEVKDPETGAILKCFVSKHVYEISGVEIAEGVEIILDGYPAVHEKYGFSLQVQALEVAGEGALKAEYEKRKAELEKEGVFSEDKKRDLPTLPQTIGVITSRTGAVVNDIRHNLGNYGFEIKLYDARVEGKRALHDLTEAMEYFQDSSVDVIVIGRGGGSLESLQAFNSEVLTRSVAQSDTPVIACIGHDKDKPLVSLAADRAESTPTGAAVAIRQSWEKVETWLKDQAVRRLTENFESQISEKRRRLERMTYHLSTHLQETASYIHNITNKFLQLITAKKRQMGHMHQALEKRFMHVLTGWKRRLLKKRQDTKRKEDRLISQYQDTLKDGRTRLDQFEKHLQANDPARLLSRGYSIVKTASGVVTQTEDVDAGDQAEIRVKDGTIDTEVISTGKAKGANS